MRQHPGRIVFVVPACVFATASCGAGDNAVSRSAAIPRAVTPPATNPTAKPPKLSNDLKTGRNERVSWSGELTLNAEHSTPVRRWASGARKPLDVTLTAFVRGDREQKVYRTAVTVYATGSDGSGPLKRGQPLMDVIDVERGYMATFPETYSQSLVFSAPIDGALRVDIDLKSKFLVLKGTRGGSREYAKHAATHSLTCSGSEHVKLLKSKWQFGGTKWRDSSYRTEALHGGSDASLGGGP
jgi:hypothetical protein